MNKKDTPGSCFHETYTLVDEINAKKKKKIQIITIGNIGDVIEDIIKVYIWE